MERIEALEELARNANILKVIKTACLNPHCGHDRASHVLPVLPSRAYGACLCAYCTCPRYVDEEPTPDRPSGAYEKAEPSEWEKRRRAMGLPIP